MAEILVIGDRAVSAAFLAAAAASEIGVRRKVGQWGMRLETKIKANASGRPGPRVITGDYRRSWNTQVTTHMGGAAAIVGTAAPQGRRLEYGFVGVDSLGRHYNQAPYPHVRPAVAEIERPFVMDMRAFVGNLM